MEQINKLKSHLGSNAQKDGPKQGLMDMFSIVFNGVSKKTCGNGIIVFPIPIKYWVSCRFYLYLIPLLVTFWTLERFCWVDSVFIIGCKHRSKPWRYKTSNYHKLSSNNGEFTNKYGDSTSHSGFGSWNRFATRIPDCTRPMIRC